jgi:esterase/lipase superfamily enzyme
MQFVDPNLPRELFGWYSHRLGLDMPIVRYGRWGRPLLLLPTAGADFLEHERFFLIKSLEPLIFAGRIQVFSVDSINKHAWMNSSIHPFEAARRQALYSGYLENEVVPHVRRCLGSDDVRLGISGASFGAFYAANAFFRRPDQYELLIAMSGFYDLEGSYLKGFSNDDIFFNNPMWFVREMHDHGTLERLRHSQIHILSGQGDYELPEASRRFSEMLWSKSIPNNLDLWGYDMKHDWPTWRAMLPHYLGERVGW